MLLLNNNEVEMVKDTLISKAINNSRKYYKNFKFDYSDKILRSHNQETYEKIIKGFALGNKVLFEQATGTGKSYLALKFLHDHAQGKNVLFVAPANAIKDSFIGLCNKLLDEDFCKIDTCLYQGLKSKQNKHYDIIIFDEVHRMGAKTWGPNAEVLMENNPKSSILGMTATLDRPDCVDVRQYFDNREPVSRITLVEALEKGILPKPDYTLAKVDFEEDVQYIDTCIKDFKEKLKQAEGEEKKQISEFLERLKKAKQAIAESADIPKIFANEINTKELKQGKFIVFCPAGEDEDENKKSLYRMKTIMKQSQKWFEDVEGIKKIKKYSVYSKLDANKNKKIINAFERDNTKALKLLFSINMLNEGLHVDDIDGVIMLRTTGSRIIYLQQLGRALSVGHKHQPKIFDFVANLNYVDVNEIQQMVTDVNKGNNEGGYGGGDIGATENNLRFKLNIDNLDTLQLIDSLKSNIFAFNRKNDFEFVDFYNRLLAYKKEYGDCLVPTEYICSDGYLLGRKISYIRNSTIKLDQIEKQRLTDIGFVWVARGLDDDGIRVDLKLFVNEYNDFVTKRGRTPKRYRNPQNQEERDESNLRSKRDRYRQVENLKNEDEIQYLQVNLINLPEISKDLIKFVEDFNAFVLKYKRAPGSPNNPKSREEKDEINLYVRWRKYRKEENLNNEEEKKYFKINLAQPPNIRKEIRDFVEDFKNFVKEYGRLPKCYKNPKNQAERDERNLHNKWYRLRRAPKLTHWDEIRFLQENGIEVVGLEEMQEADTKTDGENFAQ